MLMPKFNDLKLEDWRGSEILTDSLWVIPSRDNTGKHSGFYHGNFIPQIPHQLIFIVRLLFCDFVQKLNFI